MKKVLLIVCFLIASHSLYAEDKWIVQTPPDPDDAYQKVVFIDTLTGFLQGVFSIYKTTDGGKTWDNIYQTMGSVLLNGLYMFSDGNGFITGGNKLFLKTTDFGETWVPLSFPGINISRVYALNKEQVWIMTYGNELFFTTDGGVIWDSSDTEFESSIQPSCLYFLNTNKGFLGGYGSSGLFQTDDGGKNWVKKEVPMDTSLYSIYFLDNERGWISGADGTVMRTTNSGDNWQKLSFPTGDIIYGVCFLNSLEGWAAAVHWDIDYMNRYGKIFYTSDGGNNWVLQHEEPANSGSREIVSVFFINKNKGWASGNAGILLSMDRTSSVEESIISEDFTATPTVNLANGTITFVFSASESGYISFDLFDYMGKAKISLPPQYYQSGSNELRFDLSQFSSGLYLYRFRYGSNVYYGKLILQ